MITTVNDYVDRVHEKFPELTKNEIKRILNFGWVHIFLYVSQGHDIQIISKELFLFIGKIPTRSLTAFYIYARKLASKIRFMFYKSKAKWDGYYYFTRSESQYIDYLNQKRKKYKVFKHVFLYKLLDELKVREHTQPYIFRLKADKTKWVMKYYPEIKSDKAELIIQRDPLNMLDLLVSNNNYKYIQ